MQRGLISTFVAVLLHEPLDTPFGIHQLLLTGKKRVAVGADFNPDVLFSRAGGKLIPTGTPDSGFIIFWVNVCFHLSLLGSPQ